MVKYIRSTLALALLLLSSCQQEQPNAFPSSHLFTLSVEEGNEGAVRAIVEDMQAKKIRFTWERDRHDLQLYFKQDGKFHKGALLAPEQFEKIEGNDLLDDLTKPIFFFQAPAVIDVSRPFDLFGVVAEYHMIKDNKLYVSVHAHPTHELGEYSHNRLSTSPAFFTLSNITSSETRLSANMQHIGAFVVITLKNSTNQRLVTNGIALRGNNYNHSFYYSSSGGAFMTEGLAPFLDIENLQSLPLMHNIKCSLPIIQIEAGMNATFGFWVSPDPHAGNPSTTILNFRIKEPAGKGDIFTNVGKMNRHYSVERGRAYQLYLEWDGNNLRRLDHRP